MEIWDAYNEDCSLAGFDLIRDDKIPKGIYHLVVEVLVEHIDGSFLVMKRSSNKKILPNKYEASAGGSVLKGELPIEAIKRELFEETGIISQNFIETYNVVSKKYQTIFKGYKTIVNCKKDSIVLEEDETSDYLWLEEEAFLKMINSRKYVKAHLERLNITLNK